MTSLVYWTVLGLVIERPSYGQELYNRCERIYGDMVRLSGPSHVYSALDALKDRNLIRILPGTRPIRLPRTPYRATPLGINSYRTWLVEQFAAQRAIQELWVRQFSVFANDPGTALSILRDIESLHLKEAERTGRSSGAPTGSRAELIDDLVSERQRLAEGGLLKWLQYAQERFEALAEQDQDR
jgi:DNA-binding PadR family transcriptional regulator